MHPKGLTITEIASRLKMNRNSVSKYLEGLLISGRVETYSYGAARVFFLTQRIPISAMVSISSNLVVTLDENRKILFTNDSFNQFFGLKKEDIVGCHIVDLSLNGISGEALPVIISDVLAHEEENREVSFVKNSEAFYFNIKSMKTVFDDGTRGSTILIEDITPRKRAEAALAEREKLYRSLIENVQDVFYRTDKDGNLILVSPSGAPMFGYDSVDAVLGKNLAETLYVDPAKRKDFLDALKKTGSVKNYEVVLKRKDGTPLYAEASSHYYYDGASQCLGVEGIIHDISERYKAEAKIRDYVSHIEFLSGTLLGFLDMPADSDIYEKIASDLQEFVPDAVIVIDTYDSATGLVTIHCMLDQNARDVCTRELGRDPVGLSLPINADGFASLRTGTLMNPKVSLHEIAFRALPVDISNKLEAAFNYGEIYSIGFTRGGELLGAALIFLKKGATVTDLPRIETYAHQAAIALQRKIAEDALRESERKYRTLAEAAPDKIYIIGRDDVVWFVNTTAAKSLNLSANEIIGRPRRQFFPRDVADRQYKILKQVFDTGKPLRNEEKILYEGKEYWQDNSLVPLINDNGSIPAVLGISRDITSNKQAERTRKILSAIVQSTDDAIIGKDPQGNIISWNPAAERLYGYGKDEILGRHISLIIPPERRLEMESIIDRIQKGESVNSLETLRNKRDGTIIDVSVTISPIIDEDGTVIGASSISRDITQHKVEQRLRESEERYQSAVENINVGVYRSTGDPKGKFLWGNPTLVRILGYPTLEKLEEVEVANIFSEQDGRAKFLEELKKHGFVKNRELSLIKPDGTKIAVLVTALIKTTNNGEIECISGLVEDITERRQAEKKLQTIQKEILDVVEFLPYPTFIIDNKKSVVAWNQAIEQLTGISRTQILGFGEDLHSLPFYGTSRPLLVDLLDTPDEEIFRYYTNMRRNGAALEAETFCPLLNNGNGKRLWIRAAPLIDGDGNRIGAIGTVHEMPGTSPGPGTGRKNEKDPGPDPGRTDRESP
ncbi:MAG TPA: PAS domain-containing protein [Methanoregula sp.]|nr:PAS domain-containing protein [Methanoregula sp.]